MLSEFQPTRLYIKFHDITNKLYFGKTTKVDINKYFGSGKYWNRHINKHGKDFVKTLWVSDWFYSRDEIESIALRLSEELDIVNSNEWANLKIENGLDGGADRGMKYPDEFKEKVSKSLLDMYNKRREVGLGGSNSDKVRVSNNLGEIRYLLKTDPLYLNGEFYKKPLKKYIKHGRSSCGKYIRTPEIRQAIAQSKAGCVAWNKGKEAPEEHKKKMRKPKREIACPHCGLVGRGGNMIRYHFDNCKEYGDVV